MRYKHEYLNLVYVTFQILHWETKKRLMKQFIYV